MAKKNLQKKYGRWAHVIVAVDNVVFSIIDDILCVLLIKTTKKEYKNSLALPGALVHIDESVDDAAHRVLKEKTGLQNIFVEQLATFGAIDRDPFGRVISVAYMGLTHADAHVLRTTKEYDGIAWYSVHDLPKFAYDHQEIVAVAIERLRAKLSYTNIVHHILPKEFTLTELQKVYETILGRDLDKRNFRKKVLSLGIIKKTSHMRRGLRARPAALYSFTKIEDQVIEIL